MSTASATSCLLEQAAIAYNIELHLIATISHGWSINRVLSTSQRGATEGTPLNGTFPIVLPAVTGVKLWWLFEDKLWWFFEED